MAKIHSVKASVGDTLVVRLRPEEEYVGQPEHGGTEARNRSPCRSSAESVSESNGRVDRKNYVRQLRTIRVRMILSFERANSRNRHFQLIRERSSRLRMVSRRRVRLLEPTMKESWEVVVEYTSHGASTNDLWKLTQAPPNGYRVGQRDMEELSRVDS